MFKTWFFLVQALLGVFLVFDSLIVRADFIVYIDPAQTFLRTQEERLGTGNDTQPIKLSDYGILAGEAIKLERTGDFSYLGNNDLADMMIGLFSSSNTLLASGNFNRVPGAIGIGLSVTTPPTYYNNLATNISQDFLIANGQFNNYIDVTVPAGALYLFAAASDSYYSDNRDNTTGNPLAGTFNLHISTLIPIPASIWLVSSGLLFAWKVQCRKRTV